MDERAGIAQVIQSVDRPTDVLEEIGEGPVAALNPKRGVILSNATERLYKRRPLFFLPPTFVA